MPIHEIVFRVRRDSEYLRLLERNPAVRVYTWCNRVRDIVEVVSDDRKQLENVMNGVSPESEIVDMSSDYTRVYLIMSNCSCTPENSVPFNMEDLELIHMSPSFTSAGWEQFRVLAFKHEAMTALMDRLEERGFQVDIRRKTLFQGDVGDSMLTVESLFSELTGRQADAMITAFNHGYYRTPRVSDVKTIAGRLKVPRATFQEHLRKAETKLMASVIPYLSLYRYRAPR